MLVLNCMGKFISSIIWVTRFWWTKSKQSSHWKFLLFQTLGWNSSATLTGAVFLLRSTSHPPQTFLQGSSPSRSDPTACPGTPCHRSAQQHTGLSDGPPGRGPSNPLWRRTPSGCPVEGAVEQRCNQSVTLAGGKSHCDLKNSCGCVFVSLCLWVESQQTHSAGNNNNTHNILFLLSSFRASPLLVDQFIWRGTEISLRESL